MAYNSNNEERVELADIKKNDRGEFVKVAKITNKNTGNSSVDIRNYYTTKEGEIAPTYKGVRFNTEMTPDIIRGIADSLEYDELEDLRDYINRKLEADE